MSTVASAENTDRVTVHANETSGSCKGINEAECREELLRVRRLLDLLAALQSASVALATAFASNNKGSKGCDGEDAREHGDFE